MNMNRSQKALIWLTSLAIAFTAVLFFTYSLRVTLAGTFLTTQHPQYAWITLVGQKKIDELRQAALNPKIVNSIEVPVINVMAPIPKPVSKSVTKAPSELKTELIEIDKNYSATHYFKGRMVKINDATKVRLVPAIIHNKGTSKERGEWINEIVDATGAIAALNASGFSDPGGMSWASHPMGLVIMDGKVIQDYDVGASDTALGITYEGKLITGNYSSKDLLALGIRDAVSFKPQLVVDGKSMFAEGGGLEWGYQPRSAVGQTSDGSIIFLQIDGRKAASIGASMKDVADVMLEQGVVNAMAMDGGTSAFLSYQGKTLTVSPVDDDRGRFLPNAWVVVPDKKNETIASTIEK
jgi:exopolysaccharide biosynthesis protein